ncbi:MAG: hypothetical protein QN155_08420 [Armatimonadota bacterium]|nr:hypothetical protein [Armatimonadota bacterium]MDR7403364.1 hypothetical protein [Armatimonadota bacterium]
MPEVFFRPSIHRLPDLPRCPWCGSRYTSRARQPRIYYCHSCFRAFEEIPEVPYDFVADEWSPALGALQREGELILVLLGAGFYGVCLISVESPLQALLRLRRRQSAASTARSA